MKFYRDIVWVTFSQMPLALVDLLKNMAAIGQDIFVLYGYSANLKIFCSESVEGRISFRDL